MGGWFFQERLPLRGSILQAGTCQILSLAENPRWSRVWQYHTNTDTDFPENTDAELTDYQSNPMPRAFFMSPMQPSASAHCVCPHSLLIVCYN